MMLKENSFKRAISILKSAKQILFLSGAGISAESGIPIFRGENGLWENFRVQDLATPEAFARDPKLVWKWYNWRKKIILQKKPNSAHDATVELKKKRPNTLIVTQNVDGLHVKAGLNLREIIEMHGNIFRCWCLECKNKEKLQKTNFILPTCRNCNSQKVRPDIVWFGEPIDRIHINLILTTLQKTDVILVVGTSGQVSPASEFSTEVRRKKGVVIEINTDPPIPESDLQINLIGKAGSILPSLISKI